MKDTKKELNTWRDISTWIGRFNVVKKSVLPNLIYNIKILTSYFVDVNKMILNFIERRKSPRLANLILKDKNKVGLIVF